MFFTSRSLLTDWDKKSIRKHAKNASILAVGGVKLKKNSCANVSGTGQEGAGEIVLGVDRREGSLEASGAAVHGGGGLAQRLRICPATSALKRRIHFA